MDFGDLIYAGHTLTYWVMNYVFGWNGIVTQVLQKLTNNSFFCFLFAILLVRIGIGLIKKGKKTSR